MLPTQHMDTYNKTSDRVTRDSLQLSHSHTFLCDHMIFRADRARDASNWCGSRFLFPLLLDVLLGVSFSVWSVLHKGRHVDILFFFQRHLRNNPRRRNHTWIGHTSVLGHTRGEGKRKWGGKKDIKKKKEARIGSNIYSANRTCKTIGTIETTACIRPTFALSQRTEGVSRGKPRAVFPLPTQREIYHVIFYL